MDKGRLLNIHSEDYLNSLKDSHYVAQALEMPLIGFLPIKLIDQHILRPMRLATTGTIIAAEKALANGIGINLSGGYHHAASNQGGGFCIYSDIAMAVAMLRKAQMLSSKDQIVIIDLDAHQGNGLERIFYNDRNVHILDMYNQEIYPRDFQVKSRIDCEIPLNNNTDDAEYLEKLKETLPHFLGGIERPKIAFYNAGTDIYIGDTLGQLKVSMEGVLKRDIFVFESLTDLGIPWVMTLSGGYSKKSYQLITNSIRFILDSRSGT